MGFVITPGFGARLFAIAMLANPFLLVVGISVVVGFLMVIAFRYTSDQKAIGRAKDRLKANLLAVRLFQDQLPVVLRAYGRILMGTGTYLRLAFTPLLIAIVPIVFLMVQIDRYLGWLPIQPEQPFLVQAQIDAGALNDAQLQLPPELVTSAPAVHVPKENEVVWRVAAQHEGKYDINVVADGQTATKEVVVSRAIRRVSPVRLRDAAWDRMLSSGEPALADHGPIREISINYPAREIGVWGWQTNWIVWFFVLSLVAGFIFKELLGIQV